MKEIVLKLSEAENVLREWFEAGIAGDATNLLI